MSRKPGAWLAVAAGARGAVVILALTGAVGACGGPAGSPAVTSRDSAGVAIVESAAPSWKGGNGWTVADSPTTIPGWESVVYSRGDAGAVWGKQAHLAVHGEDVYVGSADAVEYHVHSPNGPLRRIVRVPGYDLALSRVQVEAELATCMPDPSAASDRRREIMERQPDRTHRPGYSRMLLDAGGHVWLKRYQGRHEAADPTEWLVFDTTGAWLGAIRLPPRFEIYRVGPDWVFGNATDDPDEGHVQPLSLSRNDSVPAK